MNQTPLTTDAILKTVSDARDAAHAAADEVARTKSWVVTHDRAETAANRVAADATHAAYFAATAARVALADYDAARERQDRADAAYAAVIAAYAHPTSATYAAVTNAAYAAVIAALAPGAVTRQVK